MFDINSVLSEINGTVFPDKRSFADAISASLPSTFDIKRDIRYKDYHHKVDIIASSKSKKECQIKVYYKIKDYDDVNIVIGNHSTAVNDVLVRFWEDVSDFESFVENAEKYIIFLTNDQSYWTKRDGKLSDFTIHDKFKRVPSALNYEKDINLTIAGTYEFHWKDWECGKGKFKYLVLPVRYIKSNNANSGYDINSFEDFIRINDNPQLENVFFRGQGNLCYLPTAGALRPDKAENYENKVFLSVINQNPEKYLHVSNLEKLFMMQHQELPTRLLDITTNPLVGLFFAVSSLHSPDEDKHIKEDNLKKLKEYVDRKFPSEKLEPSFDHWLFQVNTNEKDVKTFDSPVCRCLSALPYLKSSEINQLRYEAVLDYLMQIYSRKLTSDEKEAEAVRILLFYILKYRKKEQAIAEASKLYQKTHDDKFDFESLLKASDSDIINQFSINGKIFSIANVQVSDSDSSKSLPVIIMAEAPDFSDGIELSPMLINSNTGHYMSTVMEKLHAKITDEAPAFERKINPDSILNGIIVSPLQNSDRMIAQSGNFMFFGLSLFWNVGKFLKYCIDDESIGFVKGVSLLIRNDSSFLQLENDEEISNVPNDIEKIKSVLFSVFDISAYRINPDSLNKLKVVLNKMGINKATLGRSDNTTVYQIDSEISNEWS